MQLEQMEQNVLILCLKDKDFMLQVYADLSPSHFSKAPYKWIYWCAKEHFSKYGKLATRLVFMNELSKSNKLQDNKKPLYGKILNDLIAKKPLSKSYTKDQVNSYIKDIRFVRKLDFVLDCVEKGTVDKARDHILKELLYADNHKPYKITSWLKEFDKRQKDRKLRKQNPQNYIMAMPPYKCMEPFLSGIQGGEFASIIGLTSVGKSIMLHDWGAHNLLNNMNVAHFVVESTVSQGNQRYDSRVLGIPYDCFKYFSFTKKQISQIERNIAAITKHIGDKLRVVKVPQQGFSTIGLEQIFRELELSGFYTQFMLLDYADIMEPAKNYESFRLRQAGVYWDLKEFLLTRNIPGLTITQAPQEYGKADKKGNVPQMGAESAGESYWKSRILDIVLTLSQTVKQKFLNQVTLRVAKNRDGPRGAEFILTEDFKNIRFLE